MRFLIITILGFLMVMESAFAARDDNYDRLQHALITYQDYTREGSWVTLPQGVTLKPGMSDTRVPLLQKRLAQQHLLKNIKSTILYDKELAAAVMRFQSMHGIKPDGIIGKQTITALNVPLGVRINQISRNMDRLLQMPDDLGVRYILINIPSFELLAVDNGIPAFNMKIIVGKPSRQTPIFSSIITNVIFHPYWHVPASIAYDKLPKIKKDPSYLKRSGFIVLDKGGQAVSPSSINWNSVGKGNFPYTLRQNPGPHNALGNVRFSILNNMDIYMHGTPEQHLFASDSRAKSSGCIRVERPLQLTHFVLQDSPEWNAPRIDEMYLERKKTETALLPTPLPVHILYFTSWVDQYGQLQFRDDIYGLDSHH